MRISCTRITTAMSSMAWDGNGARRRLLLYEQRSYPIFRHQHSASIIWELSEGLEPGNRLEFMSRFRVCSVDRTLDLKKSTATWSDSQQKRVRVRSAAARSTARSRQPRGRTLDRTMTEPQPADTTLDSTCWRYHEEPSSRRSGARVLQVGQRTHQIRRLRSLRPARSCLHPDVQERPLRPPEERL